MKKTIIGVVLLLGIFILQCDCNAAVITPEDMAESFFSHVVKGKYDKAFDQLFEGSVVVRERPQDFALMKSQTNAVMPSFGNLINVELYQRKEFGDSILRLIYIMKFSKHPLVYQIYFYKPNDVWLAEDLKFGYGFEFLESSE